MKLPKLTIGKFTADLPIIQGGMGVAVSLHKLASAVANAGGIGVISTAGVGWKEPDVNTNFNEAHDRALKRELESARKLTKGIIGVNNMIALCNHAEMAKVASQNADIILAGAGLPMNLPAHLVEGSDTALVPIISSHRAARIICKTWTKRHCRVPDAIVVEGPLAGGHLGFSYEELKEYEKYSLEDIVVKVIEAVKPYEDMSGKKIPIIAAGGVWDGKDLAKFIKLGAAGVKISTRLVCTHECDVSPAFKQVYIDAKEEDIVLIKSPVGLPGRAIKNKFLEAVEKGDKMPFECPFTCIRTCVPADSPYCIALALINAKDGNFDEGFAFAGSNAYRCDKIVSVKEVLEEITKEAEAALEE